MGSARDHTVRVLSCYGLDNTPFSHDSDLPPDFMPPVMLVRECVPVPTASCGATIRTLVLSSEVVEGTLKINSESRIENQSEVLEDQDVLSFLEDETESVGFSQARARKVLKSLYFRLKSDDFKDLARLEDVEITTGNRDQTEQWDLDARGNWDKYEFDGDGDQLFMSSADISDDRDDDGANDIGYAGYVWNDESNNYHVRNRKYSPKLGRCGCKRIRAFTTMITPFISIVSVILSH